MDALKNTWQQIGTLYGAMSPSQRLTLVAVPIVLLSAFGMLAWQQHSTSYVPLSWGKIFTIDQLRSAEQTLIEAGLTEFRTEGQRILVPADEVERYNAALLVDGNLPSDSMSEFERQFEKSSVFTSREQLQALKEIALRNELRNVLRAVPDLEDGSVTWARSETRRWPDRGSRVTATVSLRPRRGRPLQPQTVRSIRAAVASMIPDLAPDDVTVFDQSTATSYSADRDGDPFDDKLLRWIDEHAEQYRRRIGAALAYIPEVIVAVSVDVENLKSQIVREQQVDAKKVVPIETDDRRRSTTTNERAPAAEPGAASNVPRQLQMSSAPSRSSSDTDEQNSSKVVPSFIVTETEFLAAMPKAVHVSIAIPEGYFRDVALVRGFAEGSTDAEKAAFRQQVETIRKEEEEKVRKHAMTLIPEGSTADAVHVTSVTRVAEEVEQVNIPWTDHAISLARAWGGTAGLALLAAWGLWSLSRSLPRTSLGSGDDPASRPIAIASLAEDEAPAPPPTKREVLQSFVRDNPEATAAVIGKWIQAAK